MFNVQNYVKATFFATRKFRPKVKACNHEGVLQNVNLSDDYNKGSANCWRILPAFSSNLYIADSKLIIHPYQHTAYITPTLEENGRSKKVSILYMKICTMVAP